MNTLHRDKKMDTVKILKETFKIETISAKHCWQLQYTWAFRSMIFRFCVFTLNVFLNRFSEEDVKQPQQPLHRERKCANTTGTVLVPWDGHFQFKYSFQIKYTEAILSNGTRKLLRFEITKMLVAGKEIHLLCYVLQCSTHCRSVQANWRKLGFKRIRYEPTTRRGRRGGRSESVRCQAVGGRELHGDVDHGFPAVTAVTPR